jgi:hypothetical protein
MSHNRARRGITAGIGAGAGALFAGALITLVTAPTAGAEPSNPVDQAVDHLYQGIANYFSPEAMGNAVTADQFSDLFTGEGTQADKAVDNLYQGIANFFAPETGPADQFSDMFTGDGAGGAGTLTGSLVQFDKMIDSFDQGIANFFSPEAMGNAVTADMFSDMFTGEGTLADQMVDNLYQGISMALQPEGPVDMFVDSMLGLSPF